MRTVEEQLEARVREVDDLNRIADLLRAENAKLNETLRATIETARQGEAIRAGQLAEARALLHANSAGQTCPARFLVSKWGDGAYRPAEPADCGKCLVCRTQRYLAKPSSEADKGDAYSAHAVQVQNEQALKNERDNGLLATVNARLDALNEETDKISARITGLHLEVRAGKGAQGRAIDELAAAVGKLEARWEAERHAAPVAESVPSECTHGVRMDDHCRRCETSTLDANGYEIGHAFVNRGDGRCAKCDKSEGGHKQPEAAEAGHVFNDAWRNGRCAYLNCGRTAEDHVARKSCNLCAGQGGVRVPCAGCGTVGP